MLVTLIMKGEEKPRVKILIEPIFLLTFRYVTCVSTQNSSGEKIRRSLQVFKRGDLGFN